MFKLNYAIIAIVALPIVLAACSAQTPNTAKDGANDTREARQTNALLTEIAQIELAMAPETATRLGLPELIAGEAFSSRLNNRSQAGYERQRLKRIEILEALSRAPGLDEDSRLHADFLIIRDAYETAETMAAFGHGQVGLGAAYPYVMDHMRGAYIEVPGLLTQRQTVHDGKDARAYLARLRALPDAIDDERRRLLADARSGIVPPRHILHRMQDICAAYSLGPAEEHTLYTHFDSLLAVPEDLTPQEKDALRGEALQAMREGILPAYIALQASLHQLAQTAPEAPGVWQLPDGAAYYQASLDAYTDTDLSPSDLHDAGQAAVTKLLAELDIALASEGMTEGSVAARLSELAIRPDQVFEDSDSGRAALLARMEESYARMQTQLPKLLRQVPKTHVQIRPVPDYLLASSSGAYYMAAAADGSAPGLFYINLSQPADWPAFSLPTLVFHETSPGHHTESAISTETGDRPLLRQMVWNAGYGEGWAVYSEDLAAEIGLYRDDPLGRIGYLQSLLFRAARLVADTGLHDKHWSRDEAITYLTDVTGLPRTVMEDEVDRYTVWPGQAAAYWVGRTQIRNLRTRAERVLGPKFSLRDFHQAILNGGPRPLAVLEDDIERWYGAQIDE